MMRAKLVEHREYIKGYVKTYRTFATGSGGCGVKARKESQFPPGDTCDNASRILNFAGPGPTEDGSGEARNKSGLL